MKLAICISGSIRSFPREIFRKSFENFRNNMPEFDVFIVLRTEDNKNTLMNNEKSIDEFIKTISIIKPKKIFLFDSYSYKRINNPRYSRYSIQMLMIKKCFDIAMEYDNYDYFIRYRSDFIMFDPRFNINLIDENTIYSTRKFDAPASDQVFMISKKLKNIWFDKLEYILKFPSPEYYIFNNLEKNIKLSNGTLFYGGLIRNTGNEISFWDEQIKNLKFSDTITLECSDKNFIEEKFLIIIYDKLFDLSKKMNFDIEIKNKI